jgi:hypothetical protein
MRSTSEVHVHVGRVILDSACASANGLKGDVMARQLELALRDRAATNPDRGRPALANAIAAAVWSHIADLAERGGSQA